MNLLKIAKNYNVPVSSEFANIDPIPLLVKASLEGQKIKIAFFTKETQERLIYDSIADEWYARLYLQTDIAGNDNFRLVPCDNPSSSKGKPIYPADAFKIR